MPGLPDLRDRIFFPPLSRLPHDTRFSQSECEYYDLSVIPPMNGTFLSTPDMTLRPRRHWCLLAEIVELDFWPFRPMYKVKDVTGQIFLAAFHFDDRALFPKVAKKAVLGSTICVMYASFHYFADGQVGVRLEEPRNVKILPFGLDELAAMGDLCRRAWNTDTGTKALAESCIACGKPAPKKCSLCSVAPYCSKECQTSDWKAKHKKECPITRIVSHQMRSWNEFDWDSYVVHEGFEDFI